jgi:predicted 2-oxoglutarate/Fe(II)-dependent dioxygenase YbiX
VPGPEFFAHFGILHVRSFLDTATCGRLCAELRDACGGPATVIRGGAGEVDERVRRVTWARVSAPTRALVAERLGALIPAIEQHFGTRLCRYEDPSFLRYGQGDFYLAHRDRAEDHEADPEFRARKVSVVAFLNQPDGSPAPEGYGGGALTFAGLFDDPRLRRMGVPLRAETGLLVAFRSDLLHSVTPVTHGERYTIVTWLS